MTQKHTQEPWVLDKREGLSTNFYSDDATGSIIGGCQAYQLAPRSLAERQANARRIVACVNACRGLPTEELEKKGIVSAVGNQLLDMDRKLHKAEVAAATWGDRAAKEASRAEDLQAQVDELLAALVNAKESLECCYDVTDWPCNGSTDQDKAIAIADAAINKITGETK